MDLGGRYRTQALLVVSAVLCLAFAPDNYPSMLARAFLIPGCLLLFLFGMLSVARRKWWLAAAAWLSVGLLSTRIIAHTGRQPPFEAGAGLRVAQMNLLQTNDQHAEVMRAACSTGADLIAFDEVDSCWARVLREGLGDRWPHALVLPRQDLYGIALFSKLPLTSAVVVDLIGRPAIHAEVNTPHGPLSVFAVHATSPETLSGFRERNAQLLRLAQLLRASAGPVVLMGDLNTVDWDAAYRQLISTTGLHGSGDLPVVTWPSMARLALVPLDHVAVSLPLVVRELDGFFIPGSDHRGLVADLAFATTP